MKRAIWDSVDSWTELTVGTVFIESDNICGEIKGTMITPCVVENGTESFTAAMENGRTCEYFRDMKHKHYGPKLYVRLEFDLEALGMGGAEHTIRDNLSFCVKAPISALPVKE